MISFEFIDVEVPELSSELFSLWLTEAARQEDKITGEITLIFCSDEHLLEMNRQYLNHDYYTDIITFDYSQGDQISGFPSMECFRSLLVPQLAKLKDPIYSVLD
jgi:ssRNA-specific RNase YbeY (16S rRNA maturation enzyme)